MLVLNDADISNYSDRVLLAGNRILTTFINTLHERIVSSKCIVGVVGLGYVGLPLAIALSNAGLSVVGFDIDASKIENLRVGKSYIKHIASSDVANLIQKNNAEFYSDFSVVEKCDVVILCVPTPLNKHMAPDLSYVTDTTRYVAEHMRHGQMVILESTTYPGTTSEVLAPLINEVSGLRLDEDFFLAYSPEREDPGNLNFVTRTVPKVVGADNPEALKATIALYNHIVDQVVPVSSAATAEAVKLTENIFRSVNIALVNELKTIYAPMGIDVWEVIEAASSKPFGFMPFYPGPGLGGHCIPIDPFYLSWKAKEFGLTAKFIELAGEVNRRMTDYVIANLVDLLSEHAGKAIKGANILVLGLAYKKNVGDLRESPALVIINQLEKKGERTAYYDQNIPIITPTREHPEFTGRQSVDLTAEEVRKYDAVLVVTDHDDTDWQLIADNAKLVVDTRNVMKNYGQGERDLIFKS